MFFSFLLAINIIIMLLHCSLPTLCQFNAFGRIAQLFICIQSLLLFFLYFCSICILHFYFYSISTYFNTNLIPILDQLSTNNPCCSHLYSLVLLLHSFTTQ